MAGKVLDIFGCAVPNSGTLQSPRTIWLYASATTFTFGLCEVERPTGSAAQQQGHEGRISAGGVQKDVSLEERDDAAVNKQVDEAYLAKYSRD